MAPQSSLIGTKVATSSRGASSVLPKTRSRANAAPTSYHAGAGFQPSSKSHLASSQVHSSARESSPHSRAYFASQEPSSGHESPWSEGRLSPGPRAPRAQAPGMGSPAAPTSSRNHSRRFDVPEIPPFRSGPPRSSRSSRASGILDVLAVLLPILVLKPVRGVQCVFLAKIQGSSPRDTGTLVLDARSRYLAL